MKLIMCGWLVSYDSMARLRSIDTVFCDTMTGFDHCISKTFMKLLSLVCGLQFISLSNFNSMVLWRVPRAMSVPA
jgi:hypothetical protein